MSFVFPPAEQPSVPVLDGGAFPVRRIFCIGRNYAEHVSEMGGDPKKNSPIFFSKPADAVVRNGAVIPYPLKTENLHYEGELVVALKDGGARLRSKQEALSKIFGFAAGCDLTRRDLQAFAKKTGTPWDAAKGFDNSAPIAEIAPIEKLPHDFLREARLTTSVNRVKHQDASLSEMIWPVPELLMALSEYFELRPGDLVFTGTPAGVAALSTGDTVEVSIGALPALHFQIGN